MHSAPSVEFPAGRSAFAGRLELALLLVWLMVQAFWAWSLQRWPLPGTWWLACVCGTLLFGWVRWQARYPLQGCLAWVPGAPEPGRPAGEWIWTSSAYRRGTSLASVEWTLDLQERVLLRLRNAAGLSWWIWLERGSAPQSWGDLRRALVAHQGVTAGPSARDRPR